MGIKVCALMVIKKASTKRAIVLKDSIALFSYLSCQEKAPFFLHFKIS